MYRDILAEKVIPSPNPDDRFGGAEAHRIFLDAKEVNVHTWGEEGGHTVSLGLMPMRVNYADNSYTDEPTWVVDSEGGYHRVASGSMSHYAGCGGDPLHDYPGILVWAVIERLLATGHEIVALARANIFCRKIGPDGNDWETTVHSVVWNTPPKLGWAEARRIEQERSRAFDVQMAALDTNRGNGKP